MEASDCDSHEGLFAPFENSGTVIGSVATHYLIRFRSAKGLVWIAGSDW